MALFGDGPKPKQVPTTCQACQLELAQRLEQCGEHGLEWQQILRDLKRLQQSEIEARGQRFLLRTQAQGTASAVCRAVGVALPPTIQTTQPAEETPAT